MADKFDLENDEKKDPASLIDRIKQFQNESFSMHKIPGSVDKNADVAAIVLAGGKGTRIREPRHFSTTPKQLMKMSGKPVLTWSMDSFDACGQIGCIIVVCPKEDFELYIDEVVDPFAFQTPVLMAPSGDSRQESAFNGLEFVPDEFDYVLIHDGARPLVPPSIVEHVINVLKGNPDFDGAICAHPAIDTLKVVEDDVIVGTPDRSAFWQAQTPQVFKKDVYNEAHLAALTDGFLGSDDSSLVERIGGNIKVVEGKRNNIKLTVPEDYLVLASVLHALQLEHGSDYNL